MDITYHNKNIEKLEQIKNDRHHALRIAVCGKFKSGKTSLLNLLLDTRLPVQAVTATGIVTKVIYDNSSSVKWNDNTVSSISIEEMNKLITVADKSLDGVKIGKAKTVYVGSHSKMLKRGKVEFWDTPGLEDDPLLTEITMDAIEQSDLVLCVMHANQVLSMYEKRLFQKLFELMNGNVIFVVNHMDSLHDEDIAKIVSTVQKTLKQYPNKHCKNGNLFFTSANPEQPDIESLKEAMIELIGDKVTRRSIQKTTKIGKSTVVMQEWNSQIEEEQKENSQNIIEIQSQIRTDIEDKHSLIDKQYKHSINTIKLIQENMKTKLMNELTWRKALENYQQQSNWEKNFKDGAAEWLKEYILQIFEDANYDVSKTLQECSFYSGTFALTVNKKLWKKRYVYKKNFVKPRLFPERRFQKFCEKCVDKTIPLLMSKVVNELVENVCTDVDALMKKLEDSSLNAHNNLSAEQHLLDNQDNLQTESEQLKEYVRKSEELCSDISLDAGRYSLKYKFVDFLSAIFPSILLKEIYN